jgi:PTS system nitrogen regulatory IIA component
VRLHRYIREEMIDLQFDPFARSPADPWADEDEPAEDEPASDEEPTRRQLWDGKVRILQGLVTLLERGGKVTNPKKCLTDLVNREKKATTGLGLQIAIPHVRTPQAKAFALGVAVAPEPGLWFDAIDEEPVRLFIPMIAPAHDDRFYLKVERALAKAFVEDEGLKETLVSATTPGEVILALSNLIDA